MYDKGVFFRLGVEKTCIHFPAKGFRGPFVGIQLQHPRLTDRQARERPIPLVGIVLKPMLDDMHAVGRALQGNINGAIGAVGIDDKDLGRPALDRVEGGCQVRLFVKRQDDDGKRSRHVCPRWDH